MARFLTDSGALFQHIPRTGGTFVEEAIKALQIPHNTWLRKQSKRLPKKHSLLSHYWRSQKTRVKFVFTFVRHPVDYYVSAWLYLTESYQVGVLHSLRSKRRWAWHPFAEATRLYRSDFNQWVELMVEREPLWATRLFEWYVGPRDASFCQFIGRTESLVEDLSDVLRYLGYDVDCSVLHDLGRVNSTTVPRPHVSDSTRALICHTERLLIDRFYGACSGARRWYGADKVSR